MDKRAHKAMDPFIFTFPSKIDLDQCFQHAGEEFIYVISGKVAFEVIINGASRTWTLEAGDCVYFDADLPIEGTALMGETRKRWLSSRSELWITMRVGVDPCGSLGIMIR
jgi:hypothetical protein